MAGKACTGNPTGNSDLIKESKAQCEGLLYRAQGTANDFPQTDNPHDLNSDAGQAWTNGWFKAGSYAGSIIPASEAGCCAVPHNVILA